MTTKTLNNTNPSKSTTFDPTFDPTTEINEMIHSEVITLIRITTTTTATTENRTQADLIPMNNKILIYK